MCSILTCVKILHCYVGSLRRSNKVISHQSLCKEVVLPVSRLFSSPCLCLVVTDTLSRLVLSRLAAIGGGKLPRLPGSVTLVRLVMRESMLLARRRCLVDDPAVS